MVGNNMLLESAIYRAVKNCVSVITRVDDAQSLTRTSSLMHINCLEISNI
jgi:hypothetical protein